MTRRIKSIISLMLAVVLLGTSCVFAGSDYRTKASEKTGVLCSYYEWVLSALYYHEETKDYLINIGLCGDTIDCALYYKNNPDEIINGVFDKNLYCKDPNASSEEIISTTIIGVLQDKTKANMRTSYRSQQFIECGESPKSFSEDRSLILNDLYNKGEPVENNNPIQIDSGTINYNSVNYSVKLYKTTDYVVTKLGDWIVYAGNTYAFIQTLLGLGQLGVIGLLVALATGVGGEITAIDNVVGRTYNVYERLDKLGRVFDYESICLRRTRTWRSGINADNEVGSEFKSDNIPTNYFNHAAIMQAAVEYYISTGM